MNNKLTLAAVVLAHACVILGLTTLGGGCRSTTGMEREADRRAFTGFPGESGASGYEASATRSAPVSQAAVAQPVNPPSAVVEPAAAPTAVAATATPVTPVEPAAAPTEVAPAAVTPATAEPKAVGAGRTYLVKKNESLWIIAKREGVSIDELTAANGIKRNATLREGQKLVIPASTGKKVAVSHAAAPAAATKSEGSAEGTYVVKKGDSLGVIARKLGTTSAALRSENSLKGDSIREGQKLRVPADAKNKGAAGTASTAAPVASGSAATAKPVATGPATAKPVAPASAGFAEVPLMGAPAAAPASNAAPAPAPAAAEPVEATPVSQ